MIIIIIIIIIIIVIIIIIIIIMFKQKQVRKSVRPLRMSSPAGTGMLTMLWCLCPVTISIAPSMAWTGAFIMSVIRLPIPLIMLPKINLFSGARSLRVTAK